MDEWLSPQTVLQGIYKGVFPMADADGDGQIHWYDPELRGIIPLDGLKVSRSLQNILNRNTFVIKVDTCFEEVLRKCGNTREQSWINEQIVETYCGLHHMGFAHSVEVFENGKLVGGLYGVAVKRLFSGESMFHLVPNASKIALYYLVDILKKNNFTLLDTQYINPFLEQMGGIEIEKEEYLRRLEEAIE